MPVTTILMVDDNPVDVSFLRYALETVESTAVVSSAADKEAAFQHLRHQAPPDLLVLDLFLGGETGLDLLEQLRAEHRWCPPAVLLSGLVPPSFKQAAQSQGVPCLDKPSSFEGWCALAQILVHPDLASRTSACAA